MRVLLQYYVISQLALMSFFIEPMSYAGKQNIPCYRFHWGDSPGNDIGRVYGDILTIADACSENEDCVAFNISGWIKFKLNPSFARRGSGGWYERDPTCGVSAKCLRDYEDCLEDFFCNDLDPIDDFDPYGDYACEKCKTLLNAKGCREPKAHKDERTGQKPSAPEKNNNPAFFSELDRLLSTDALTKEQAISYLNEIGSWLGIAEKDPKRLYRKLLVTVHSDKCVDPAIQQIVKKAVAGKGFPGPGVVQDCQSLHRLVSGLSERIR